MAGAGRRTFTPGEVLTASNVMSYLQDQSVMNFAGTAARGSAIGTAVSEGMVSYLADSNVVQAYDGSAWNSLAYATAVVTPGLVPIIPTSVDKSGGTATANSLGQVTFTGVSSVSMNGVFTSAYKNYKLILNFSSFSAANDIFARMRSTGTDNSATNYHFAGNAVNTASANGTWVNPAGAQFHLSSNAAAYGIRSRAFIEFWDPQLALPTKVFWQSMHDNGSTWTSTVVGGTHSISSAYDGFTIYPTAGTMTGTLSIYGYNN